MALGEEFEFEHGATQVPLAHNQGEALSLATFKQTMVPNLSEPKVLD